MLVLVHVVLDRPQFGQILGPHGNQEVRAPHALKFNQSAGFRTLLEVVNNLLAMGKVLVIHLAINGATMN